MLQNRISKSRKMSELSSDTARLLYTWLLSHLDVNGCFYADPVMIKNLIFTRLDTPIKTVSTILNELEVNELIVRYEVDGELYLCYPDFEEKQPKIQRDREGKPDIPPPTQDQLKSNSRVTPPQEKIREDKTIQRNSDETILMSDGIKEVLDTINKEREILAGKKLRGFSDDKLIKARLEDKYTVFELCRVVMLKASHVNEKKLDILYFQPSTLFGPENFKKYLHQADLERA